MNIEQIIKNGESQIVEFKESFDREAIETAVAFSNSKGGIIFVGVADDGKMRGITIGAETLREWSNYTSQVTEPTVIPELESLEFNGKKIVIIRVQEFPLKPVSFRGRCFKRVSNSNRQMSPQEIAQMHLQSTGNKLGCLARCCC
ncbi:MAG: putative DNA binding domain-containing protein [Thermodesulfobacteriota bacterium]|nr:putative DNA binding domain-containing protein [Thermodesulfobacteriota bacterium]